MPEEWRGHSSGCCTALVCPRTFPAEVGSESFPPHPSLPPPPPKPWVSRTVCHPGSAGQFVTQGQQDSLSPRVGRTGSPRVSRTVYHSGSAGQFDTQGQQDSLSPRVSRIVCHPGSAGQFVTLGQQDSLSPRDGRTGSPRVSRTVCHPGSAGQFVTQATYRAPSMTLVASRQREDYY